METAAARAAPTGRIARRPAFLCGLVGSGIGASRSPDIHTREGEAQGIDLVYEIIDLHALGLGTDALPDILASAERAGFSGLNITHPCKQAILPHLHDLSADAEALGAVNTVLLRGGRRTGHNTDWWGYAEAFRRAMSDARRSKVVQFGAGGAGAAVAYALLMLGVEHLTIVDIEPSRADTVASGLAERFPRHRVRAGGAECVREADGIVNTTPVGMDAHPGMPLDAELLRPDLWVSEIVYFPLETALLRAARAIGCRTLDGGGMVVFQAAEAFRLFTGRNPEPDRMLSHFLGAVGSPSAQQFEV